LLPEYEKAAQELAKSPAGAVLLAKVDATEHPDLATNYSVSAYPTLKVFRKGKASQYKNEAREKWGMYSIHFSVFSVFYGSLVDCILFSWVSSFKTSLWVFARCYGPNFLM
jgi:hypothetical protein